jgi:predicted house-cleaning noncanonical NTP pyrophosphatase (MazG superfamily)
MKKNVYHKLIRDKIPDVIKQAGLECETTILDEDQYYQALISKLLEEVHKLETAESNGQMLQELADVYEIILSLLNAKGYTISELEDLRHNKYLESGGFEKGLCLKSVSRRHLAFDE